MTKQYQYSEIFNSIQGEGMYTGHPTAWVRFFLCNLQCNGFGQDDPADESTYDLPYKKIDLTNITCVEDLPVFSKGCDSSYTWSKRFKHLMHKGTANDIAGEITRVLTTDSNPKGAFFHPFSKQRSHLCFTGGEPLMKDAQAAAIEIVKILAEQGNHAFNITWETNGTQRLTEDFINYFIDPSMMPYEIMFSVSPKLRTVSGEKRSKAIKPEIVGEYCDLAYATEGKGQLKFVMGKDQRQWDELYEVVELYRKQGVDWPVWIMPVSATVEGQNEIAGEVAKLAFERGYNVAARVHCYLFGNKIGT